MTQKLFRLLLLQLHKRKLAVQKYFKRRLLTGVMVTAQLKANQDRVQEFVIKLIIHTELYHMIIYKTPVNLTELFILIGGVIIIKLTNLVEGTLNAINLLKIIKLKLIRILLDTQRIILTGD